MPVLCREQEGAQRLAVPVREQVAEHEANVPFVVYDEHSARASIDDEIGHDLPRLSRRRNDDQSPRSSLQMRRSA